MEHTIYAYGLDGVTIGRFSGTHAACINQSFVWKDFNTFQEPFTVEILYDGVPEYPIEENIGDC